MFSETNVSLKQNNYWHKKPRQSN